MNKLLANRVVSAAARGRVLVAMGVTAAFLTIVVQFLVLPALEWANDEGAADELRPAGQNAIAMRSEELPPRVPAEREAAVYHLSTPASSGLPRPQSAAGARPAGAAVDHRTGVIR